MSHRREPTAALDPDLAQFGQAEKYRVDTETFRFDMTVIPTIEQ